MEMMDFMNFDLFDHFVDPEAPEESASHHVEDPTPSQTQMAREGRSGESLGGPNPSELAPDSRFSRF